MKRIVLLLLMQCICTVLYSQDFTIKELKGLLSEQIKNEEWLNSIVVSSIKYTKEVSNNEIVALVSIDTLYKKDGSIFVNDEIPYFLVHFSRENKKIITWEEVVIKNNFVFLAEIISKSDQYVVFRHFSHIGMYWEYYVVSVNNGSWYKTEQFFNNEIIDYTSFDLTSEIFYVYDCRNAQWLTSNLISH